MATVTGIQGQLLDVTVVRCSKLKDTEWISRQDPYVCLEYASTKFRTRTCTDGGKNPVFQEKINIPLIEGLREITVTVWNSNTITFDDFIGSGRIQLQKVLSQGYDDSSWPLQSKSGKFAGEVTVIMHFATAKKGDKALAGHAPTQPTHMPTAPPSVASYAPPPPSYAPPAYPSSVHPGPSAGYPPYGAYPSQPPVPYPAGYPPVSYPATSYAPPPMPQAYPPQTYPPATYPPQPYPPPPQAQPYYPPGSYPGAFPHY